MSRKIAAIGACVGLLGVGCYLGFTVLAPKFARHAPVAIDEPGKQVPVPRRGQSWENSLGMKFIPVGDILVGIWPVRKGDYAVFRAEEGRAAKPVDFPQEDSHPVVRVNWEEATAFCEWLTRRELAAQKLEQGQVYRLPTDAEWSVAAGIASEGGETPEQRDGIRRELPWGKAWPPPADFGNFADGPQSQGVSNRRRNFIVGYSDGFPQTSPAGSFSPNQFGLFDMSGNVWQWVSDGYRGQTEPMDWGVLRGGSWATSKREELRLGYREVVHRSERDETFGFRCVLVPER
jgi:eukaryotic-like serine/threonine-protein kinase